ncbi:MAG TPA: hypothetical protein VMS17_28565, partial [Gemmataceae bacterium]|nr:hypothetical protein [Gemmataceae bacterium]
MQAAFGMMHLETPRMLGTPSVPCGEASGQGKAGPCFGRIKEFAEFLRVDPDLIEAAAASPGAAVAGPSPEEIAAWIAALPEDEKNGLLLSVVRGEAGLLASELLRRCRQDQAREPARAEESAPRTIAVLLAALDKRGEARRRLAAERAAREKARRAREEAAARERHLESLAGREEELWREVETAISTKQPKEYDRALSILKDLRALAERSGASASMT